MMIATASKPIIIRFLIELEKRLMKDMFFVVVIDFSFK
jgi:hypothetical protein